MSAQEGLRLLDATGNLYEALIDTTDHEFSIESSLVDLLDDNPLPLSGLEDFFEHLFVPNDRVALDEIDLAEFCLHFGEAYLIHLVDNNCVQLLEALCKRVKFCLETDSFVNEGG